MCNKISGSFIQTTCKMRYVVLLLAMLLFFRATSHSQDKKVAILECVDKVGDVKYGHRMMLRTNLTNAINKTQGYQAIARLNLSSIIDEQKFQRSGYVSDQQIKKIGELNGATHLLIAEVANYSSTEVVVNAQLINVETGQIENTSEGIPVNFVDAQKMKSACDEIAAQLLGIEGAGNDYIVVTAPQNKYGNSQSKEKAVPEGYVDLGLPSGTKWKDKNQGGGFYTYDEAVRAFGNSLPTKEQFEELKNFCEWTWTGNGYKVTGDNGNSIFLPASGYRWCNGDVDYVGSRGLYWSSTPDDLGDAWLLRINSGGVSIINLYDRCFGQSVRLVQD